MPRAAKDLSIVLISCALLGVQVHCVQTQDRFAEVAGEPTISSFTVNPTSITSGGTAQVLAVFTNGTGVLNPGNLPVTSKAPMVVTPATTTAYTLTVKNATGAEALQIACVSVVKAPSAEISANLVQASGAEQSASGFLSNGAIVGELTPAMEASAASGTIQIRDDFLPPGPTPSN